MLTGFRKSQSTQLDAMFINLSRVFDTVNCILLIAKLGAHGFQKDEISFIKIYFTKRQQRIHVNSKFSTWERILSEDPQGLILSPLSNLLIYRFFVVVNLNLSK